VEGIVLAAGSRLADLMIEHEVGLTSRPVKVPKLDSDYFDERWPESSRTELNTFPQAKSSRAMQQSVG
jgi:hypothetical protein